jgi:ketosteroid isomerase-like protein
MPDPSYDPPRTPRQVSDRLVEHLTTGDIDGALSLYGPDSAFNNGRHGGVSFGLSQIRESLKRFTELKPALVVSTSNVIQTGDIALMNSHWLLKGTRPDGTPVEMGGHGSDVMARQPDGSWKFLIDNAWAIEA